MIDQTDDPETVVHQSVEGVEHPSPDQCPHHLGEEPGKNQNRSKEGSGGKPLAVQQNREENPQDGMSGHHDNGKNEGGEQGVEKPWIGERAHVVKGPDEFPAINEIGIEQTDEQSVEHGVENEHHQQGECRSREEIPAQLFPSVTERRYVDSHALSMNPTNYSL